MPLAHPPLATTRHTSHRPTLKKAFQPTNAKSFPTNWALWCWAPWLIHLLGPTRNIFSAHWKAPTFDTFLLTPFWGGKNGKITMEIWRFFSECQAKLWQVTCLSNIERPVPYMPYLPKGPFVSIWQVVYTNHAHVSIHLSFKMPYISAIHSQSFDAMQYLIWLKFYLCVCVTLCSRDFVGFEYLPMLTICKAQVLYLVSGAVLLFPISVLMKQSHTRMINCRKMIFEYKTKIVCRTWMYMVHCNMAWS